MTTATTLRNRIARGEILVLPGASDALTARVIEDAGFDAVYVTGAGFANSAFALPDIGFIGLSDIVEHASRMTDAVNIPVVVDADTGYGELLQVRRTVRELERVGVAAIQLEDQVAPKKCGHFEGQQLITKADMVAKLKIALDSRRDSDLVIIARTDARGVEGLASAIDRARAYAAAGADVVFVEALQTREEVLEMPSLISAPLLANMVEGGKTPVLSAAELEEAGYGVALFANTAMRVSIAAVRDAMHVLHAQGSTDSLFPKMLSWTERQEMVGLSRLQKIEDSYAVDLDMDEAGPPATDGSESVEA